MKRTISKTLSILLVCVMVFTVLPVFSAFAEDSPEIVASGYCGLGTSSNLRWTLDSEGLLTISGAGNMHDYRYWDTKWDSREEEIKKVVIEDGVRSIGYNAFCRCTALTEITIPESVTSIVHSAFSGCSSLTHITIPQAVGIINNDTFHNCSSLEEIVIPDNVTALGNNAFSSCESLKSVVFGSSLTSIGYNAFNGCPLTELDLPESLTSIGDSAFSFCNEIRSITIRSNLTSIGENNFTGYSLERIDVLGENPVYASENGVLLNRDKTEILCYPKASPNENYTAPDSITGIGDETFRGASNLTAVTLPEGLTHIGTGAFRSCGKLQRITIPAGVTSIADSVFDSCSSLREVVLPDSLTSIGKEAFRCCSLLDAVAIPENVTSIGENAFYDCKLTSLEVAPGNTVYHSYGNCLIDTEEKQILKAAVPFTIPSDGSVTSFARYAVSSYYGESLTLPKYITDLGFNSFPYVKNVYYDGTPEEYRAIERMSDTIKLGKAIVHFTSFAEPPIILTGYCGGEGDGTNVSFTQDSVGKLILSGTGITKSGTPGYWLHSELIVNEGVTSIADRMFYDTRYTSVTLPASLESIGEYAFWHNESLRTLTIPADSQLKKIGPGAFSMTPLSAFTIPQGVTVIENDTFSQTKLEYVVIPQGVASIGKGAFNGCRYLENVFYGGSEEEWNALPIDEYNDALYSANIHFNAAWHTPGEAVPENVVPATCTAGGSYDAAVYCTQCGYEFSRTHVTTDPTGHLHTELRGKIDATRDAHGHEAGKYCTDCGRYVSGGEDVHNKNGSRYRVQDATWLDEETYNYCCANGDYIIYCTVCDGWGLYKVEELRAEGIIQEQPDEPDGGDNGGGIFNRIREGFQQAFGGVIEFLLRLIKWFGNMGKK